MPSCTWSSFASSSLVRTSKDESILTGTHATMTQGGTTRAEVHAQDAMCLSSAHTCMHVGMDTCQIRHSPFACLQRPVINAYQGRSSSGTSCRRAHGHRLRHLYWWEPEKMKVY